MRRTAGSGRLCRTRITRFHSMSSVYTNSTPICCAATRVRVRRGQLQLQGGVLLGGGARGHREGRDLTQALRKP